VKATAGRVVAFWMLLNLALASILAGFGEWGPVLILYYGAVVLTGLIALAVQGGRARWRRRPAWWQAPNGDVVLITAVGLLITGLGVAFYPYLALVALPVFALALTKEITLRKNKPRPRSAATATHPPTAAPACRSGRPTAEPRRGKGRGKERAEG
jgi:hypothetical protein